jgi:hypothetical protein
MKVSVAIALMSTFAMLTSTAASAQESRVGQFCEFVHSDTPVKAASGDQVFLRSVFAFVRRTPDGITRIQTIDGGKGVVEADGIHITNPNHPGLIVPLDSSVEVLTERCILSKGVTPPPDLAALTTKYIVP